MQVFVPLSEGLIEQLGLSPEDLVPFQLDYEVLRPGEAFPPPARDVQEILEA